MGQRKRAPIFVKKCHHGGEIKKMRQKRSAKLWASKQHLQKVLNDNESFRPQKLNIKIKK